MSYLDELAIGNRIITAAKPRRRLQTIEYRREKLIANIEEQIELVSLALDGKPLELKRKRGRKIIAVRPRLWWVADDDGTVHTGIRYNKVFINLAGRGTSIQAPSLKALPELYRTVIKAVEAGELDQSIQLAAKQTTPKARTI